jgi:large subunit ribosomal protein L9
MEIILKKDYEKLGKAMDIVKVKDGFARNFLIPQGIAMPATKGNKKMIEESIKLALKKEEKRKEMAKEMAKKIEKIPCTIKVKVGEDDKLFGSVTSQEISDFLKKEGYEIDKKSIEIEEPIKQLGVYIVKINLHKDVFANLKVWVVKEE